MVVAPVIFNIASFSTTIPEFSANSTIVPLLIVNVVPEGTVIIPLTLMVPNAFQSSPVVVVYPDGYVKGVPLLMIVAAPVVIQPNASVTVTVYEPIGKLVAVEVVCELPSFHK